jgi:hypothetical protein
MIDYYQSHKQRERRLRRRRIAAFFLTILLVVFLSFFYWLMHSRYLEIKYLSFDFDGKDGQILEDKITQIYFNFLGEKNLSKFFLNDKNILVAKIYKNQAALNIKNQVPLIKEVLIKTNLIRGEVSIRLSLREKYGIWCFLKNNLIQEEEIDNSLNNDIEDSSSTILSKDLSFFSDFDKFICYWFDSNGIIFDIAPSTQGQLINKVIDLSGDNINHLGEAILPLDKFKNLLEMFNVIKISGLSYQTLYLKDKNTDELSTSDSIKPVFYFSLRNNPSYAIGPLKNMFSTLKNASYIDLRVPNRIYYR